MDLSKAIADLTNTWSIAAWIEKKRNLADCVWCEGAILHHDDLNKIYLAPAPIAYGVVYEIGKSDLLEVVDTKRTQSHLDMSFKISRVYIRKSAVLLRLSSMLATEIPADASDLQSDQPEPLSQRAAVGSLFDLHLLSMLPPGRIASEANGKSGGGGGGEPHGGASPNPGGKASGVRG